MEWINVKDKLPEDCIPSINVQEGEWSNDDFIECLVHTNRGYYVTTRCHRLIREVFEYEPNVLGSKVVDRGWYWSIEIGNEIKENPIWVDHWGIIPEVRD